MSVIDKIHMLKKILKEAKNIVAWQADIFTDLNVHKGNASAHHAKTTLFSELTDRWTLAQAHRGANDKIMVFKGPDADPVEEDKPVAKLKAGSVTDTTTAGGLISVTFAEAFASTPVVMVQLEGDVDYYSVITAKSTTGFTVKILKTEHKHSQGNTGAEAAHTHGISFASGAGSVHKHSNPNTSAISAGTPSGSISSVSAGTPSGSIGAEASHYHGISLTSGAGSAHKHSQGSTSTPSATTTVVSSVTSGVCGSGHSNCVVTQVWTVLVAGGGHTHTNPDTGTESSHSHGVSGTSGPGSSHSHGFSGDALPGHNHTFSGSALGTHSHTIGDTGNESAHTHSVSGTSGAGSSHSHSNPDTAEVNAGNTLANTEVTFSYIAMVP